VSEGGTLRVLVVDDDPEDVEIVVDLLREREPDPYAIRTATTFEEGLQAVDDHEPDICFVDYRLGARSGVDFIREVLDRAPTVPVVLLTGGGGLDVDRLALEAGAADYLPKSDLTADRLERTLRYAVERSRRQRVEGRFRALIEHSHDLISIVGPDGALRYVSPSLSRALGHDPEEKVGTSALLEVHPDDRGRVEEQFDRLRASPPGTMVRLRPYRVRHGHGGWRVLDTQGSNHLDNPAIRGVVVHSRDITDETSNREKIRFQADLLSAVGQAVIATDMEGIVLYWNPAAEALHGWTRDEALGVPIDRLTVPEASDAEAREVRAALGAGRSWSGEVDVSRKDGSTFTALATSSPIVGPDGELQGIIGVSSDISHLKRTEDALRERVKELRALHDVSRILNDLAAPVEARLQAVAEVVSCGWLEPEITEACITLGERTYRSTGFTESPRIMSASIAFGEADAGRIDVVITEDRPDRDLGAFLREERDLLDNVAGLIGEVLRRERLGRRLSRTVSSLDEAVLVVRGRTIQEGNPAAERIFGYDRDELVGSGTEKLHVDAESFRRFGSESTRALLSEGVFRGTYPMRRRDGSMFEAAQTVSLLDPDMGLEGGVISVVRDVSEQQRAERALRSSEERFRQIAESIDDVFWVSTADRFELEYVSPSFAQIWGHPVEAVLKKPSLWMDPVVPGDRGLVMEALESAKEDGYEIEYRIVRPDGELRWIFDRAFPVREDGELVRFIGVAEDITNRKLAEERFAVLGQQVADGIQIIAPDGQILFATPAAATALGYPAEALRGRNALELVHPDDRPELAAMLADLVREPGRVARRQYRGTTAEGQVRYLESVGRNRIDHPAIRGVVVTTRDISERHRLEEQLRQSQKMEAVGRLAGGIAHDFNNLLTVIRSQTDLLLIDLQDRGVPESASLAAELETIQAAADRAAALTSQLLAFSREQILQPRVVDLSDVVFDMARLLERVIGEDVAFHRELDPDLPAVRVDPGQLEQAVMNLAVNARDAMPGGGTLTLRTLVDDVDSGGPDAESQGPVRCVVLEVADTGTGMDAATLAQIFEPFFTTKEMGKGTGLGLSMVYGVVTQSGGTVHVASEPGQGSTFRLAFPAVDDKPERREAVPLATGDGGTIDRRILIVEDDDAVRRVAVRILERVGMTVAAVGSAEEGLERLGGEHDFDLLLTDLVLPGMSGRALVDRLRTGGSDVPILVMSGYAADSPGERGDLPGDVAFIQKPFTPKALTQAVREVMSRR